MHMYLTWINILIENLMIYLMWDTNNLTLGHWQDVKSKSSGIRGVVEEMEEEIWNPPANEGPFERPGEDYRRWMDYVNGKRAILTRKITNVENRLLAVQTEMDSLSKENDGKIPVNDNARAKDNSSLTIKDISRTLKHHLHVLRNWSAYLDEVKTNWDEEIPIKEVDGMMSELESKGDVTASELTKMNGLLTKNLGKGFKTRKVDSNTSCSEREAKADEAMRQMQKNLSETFLYKNVTLAEINQMSKIVDFVERYRGRVEKMGGKKREPEVAGR